MAERPSRLQLAQLRAGDLNPEEAAAVRAWLAHHPQDRARLDELEGHAAAFEASGEAQRQALRARLRATPTAAASAPRDRWWRRPWIWAPTLAALAGAAAITLLVLPSRTVEPSRTIDRGPGGDPAATVRFKGSLGLRIVAKRGERQRIVRDGDLLAAGDALRFVVTTDRPGYLTVLSLDGRGTVSPFYPATSPDRSPAPLHLRRPGRHALPGSVILDDAPGPERLIVAFSPERFERAAVHRRIRQALLKGAAPRLAGLTIELLTVDKRRGGAGAPR